MGLRLVVIACVLVAAAPVRADTVALLPLDGEARLEMYGQPVAAEIGRRLKDNGLDVVVVGAKMAVPESADLIVDGTIKADKKRKDESVTLELRIRDPKDGTLLEQLPAVTSPLDDIDKAAAVLSAKVVPSVRTQLARLATKPAITPPPIERPEVAPVETPAGPSVAVAISMIGRAGPAVQLLRAGLDAEVAAWARKHGREMKPVDPFLLEKNGQAPANVAKADADLGIALHVLGFSITPGKVPMGRARVRVRFVDRDKVRFDRVVVTDTIIGDRTITPEAFAARAAREVLAIVQPNLRRAVSTWK
jgi:hypothetical protein